MRIVRLPAVLVVAGLLGACATAPPERAAAVPEGRQYATPPAGPAVLTVTRDDGLFGSICGVRLYVDGVKTAQLGPGERVSYRVAEGSHIIGADMSAGLCNAGLRETQVETAAGQPTRLRISTGGAGDLNIAPTAF